MPEILNRKLGFLLLLQWISVWGITQNLAPRNEIRENPGREFAFVQATLVPAPGKEIPNGVMLVHDGKIVQVGTFGNVEIPSSAQVVYLSGKRIYPAFIDAWSSFGIPPAAPSKSEGPQPPQYDSKRQGQKCWNDAVKPEFSAESVFQFDTKAAESLRACGFAFVNSVPDDGIFRGSSALVSLAQPEEESPVLLNFRNNCMSFEKGSSRQVYPSSQMGAIALIRQTFLDAKWYQESKNRAPMNWLDLLIAQMKSSLNLFEVKETAELFRAEAIAKESGQNFIYKTNGDEYEWPDQVAALKPKLIIPLKFPKAMEIANPADGREISLARMRRWIQAPSNPQVLESKKVFFAFTLSGLEKPEDVFPAIRKAIAYGLPDSAALAALTTRPAQLLGIDKGKGGTLAAGNTANFIICSDSIFSKNNLIHETWIQGRRHTLSPLNQPDLRGSWESQIAGTKFVLRLKGKAEAPEAGIREGADTNWIKTEFYSGAEGIRFSWKIVKGERKGAYRFDGILKETLLSGYLEGPDGRRQYSEWKANGGKVAESPEPANEYKKPEWIPPLTFPNKAFGRTALPEARTVLIRHATVWTNTSKGKLENADVLIRGGKIAAVGKGLSVPGGADEIDAKGMHLSPGIIDEHSHIAISKGVNEGSHTITSEVRIGDVIDPTDINIYRQLAGGVTTSHLLHGSANSIGGQTALIKLRWGLPADSLKFKNADPFIKFALGENVKQSNWGDMNVIRYPQTRMGVEQIIFDAFSAAQEYKTARDKGGPEFRRDLQLEALLEILDKKRFITCHSYVQSEITMLIRLAEHFGFRVNTFTHVLEGYKIADKLKAHGSFASTFSDWWAYKYEVVDAIPQNASLLTEKGVVTCINSDDGEMGRRLNQEAAKAMRYGGMSEEDALKMVTLNPAKALHIDKYVGSIAEGMDADLVLWSGNPLSVYSRAEKTWVDGKLYFDREEDRLKTEADRLQKSRLIQLMMESQEPGKVPPLADKPKKEYHCETLESDYNE